MKKYRKVLVQWRDAITQHGWENADEAAHEETAHCESIGYLISRSKTEVVIAQTVGGEQINGRIHIPVVFLRGQIRTLKV